MTTPRSCRDLATRRFSRGEVAEAIVEAVDPGEALLVGIGAVVIAVELRAVA